MSNQSQLTLGELASDLVQILEVVAELRELTGSASYDEVQVRVADDLALHLLSYVRFLEGESLLSYDRITDQMEVSPEGAELQELPEQLRDSARQAFADELGDGQAELASSAEHAGASVSAGGGGSVSAGQGSVSAGQGGAADSARDTSVNGELDQSQWTASEQGGAMGQQAFEKVEELGSGGIGTVYRGRQVRLDREVAIKEVREIFNVFAGVQRGDIIARFESIIQTQASLIHPNIIQIIDVDTTGEYPFSVMQLAPNGNLRRLIEHGDRPPLKTSLKYFLQILHALNTAHDQGVVHGSVKPENIVLDHAGNAMVTDFGVSRIVEREGGRGNQVYVGVGTVAYMSPEQFQDPNLATVKSDIYSLGIMFYEMLTGKVPGRRSPMPSSFYPDIPRSLDDIFDRMSMDREEDRYDAVDEIIEDIYASEEVMEILDKRSGVLFLRDPMAHGEDGLGGDSGGASVAAGGDGADGDAGQGDEEAEAETSEEISEATEDDEEQDSEATDEEEAAEDEGDEKGDAQEEEEGDSSDDDESDGDAAGDGEEDGDVLEKLDKYGEMFEE